MWLVCALSEPTAPKDSCEQWASCLGDLWTPCEVPELSCKQDGNIESPGNEKLMWQMLPILVVFSMIVSSESPLFFSQNQFSFFLLGAWMPTTSTTCPPTASMVWSPLDTCGWTIILWQKYPSKLLEVYQHFRQWHWHWIKFITYRTMLLETSLVW